MIVTIIGIAVTHRDAHPWTAKKDRKPDDPAQYKRFPEAARDAHADETEKGADRAFKSVIKRERNYNRKNSCNKN
jgi:hypothetical protein